MTKNKFQVNILPLNNMLIGFSYQQGVIDDNESNPFEEYSIGLGLVSFCLLRTQRA